MKYPEELTLLTLSRKLDALAADVRVIRKALPGPKRADDFQLVERQIVESWLDKHEVPNRSGLPEGPRTIMVNLEDAEDLKRQIKSAIEAAKEGRR